MTPEILRCGGACVWCTDGWVGIVSGQDEVAVPVVGMNSLVLELTTPAKGAGGHMILAELESERLLLVFQQGFSEESAQWFEHLAEVLSNLTGISVVRHKVADA